VEIDPDVGLFGGFEQEVSALDTLNLNLGLDSA
jgi:hypothetical protein